MVPDLITDQQIRIKIVIKQKEVSFMNMDCLATLQGNSVDQAHVRQNRYFVVNMDLSFN
jgi:hypothetical protein